MSTIRIAAALFASGVLGACAASPETPLELDGTQWTLASADAGPLASLAAKSEVTLNFEAARIAGYGGCNQYSGSYTLQGTTVTVGPVSATKRGCIGDGDVIERAWFAVLGAPFTVERSGETLTVRGADGTRFGLRRSGG
jgi:heat shock protein HslJ